MKKEAGHSIWVGIMLLGLCLSGGCAASKTYLLNFDYDPSSTSPFLGARAKPANVVVYNLQDLRPEREFLGRRVYRDGMADFFKPDAGTVEQVVTKSIARLLEKSGFKVTLANRYLDPEKTEFKDIAGDIAFGGKIETLWVEAKTGIATTDTEARIRLRVFWGLVKERTWISKSIEGSAQETDRPLYQPKHAEAKINEVFKDSLDKLLKDESQIREKLLKN